MRDDIVRFGVRHRIEHAAIMTLFIVLSVTGFPQKFHDAAWAQTLTSWMGGVETARWIHRLAGIAFSVLAIVHITIASALVVTGRSLPSLIPTRKDFVDAIVTLKYYLGVSHEHARFDRFDYRQKFEYWGLVFGGVVMIGTGFVLYLPTLLTRYLPGEVVPMAKVAHSNEGLMAFLVVITWHVYNAHFSPDTFPFDKSIFTGKISRQRMEHEHPLELERILGRSADRIDAVPAAPSKAADEVPTGV